MAEPSSTAAVAVAAGGLSLVAGTLFGLPVAGLVFGFAGGLIALKLDTVERPLIARVSTVAMGTVVAAATVHAFSDRLGTIAPLAAIVVGYGAEALLRKGLALAISAMDRLDKGAP